MSEAKRTTDLSKIKSWAEERGGKPAMVKGTTTSGSSDGLLRIHFPEASDNKEDFEIISWEKFGDSLAENSLVLLYQDKKENGEKSTFHKLVDRDDESSLDS